MNEFTIEDLDKLLEYPTVGVLPTPNPDKYFDRYRHFKIGNDKYYIEWWRNICYLHGPGNITVPFVRAKRSNTWPNHSKMNIQLYDKDNNVCGILMIQAGE